MGNTYLAGSAVQVSATFLNGQGAATDPTAVTLTWQAGDNPPVTAVYPASPVVRSSAGVYYATLDTTGSQTAPWVYEWAGTGAVQAVSTGSFQVQQPVLAGSWPL